MGRHGQWLLSIACVLRPDTLAMHICSRKICFAVVATQRKMLLEMALAAGCKMGGEDE